MQSSRLEKIFEDALGSTPYRGNSIEVLKNGKEIFPAMLKAMEAAQRCIELLTFVYWEGDIAGRFADMLGKKARDGLRVRVILDALGCQRMPSHLIEKMQRSGVDIEWFRPLLRWKIWKSDHRTHRKILICDRKVAFTGGVGIADEWDGNANDPSEWRDTHFRIEGPAVSGIFSGFAGNWLECGRSLSELLDSSTPSVPVIGGDSTVMVVRSPAAYGWTDFATLVRLLITVAQHSIHITSAYFNPDKTSSELLISAANRGVTITIIVPGRYTDQKAAKIAGEAKYGPLLEAGIEILHYQQTMLHAKIITVDGRIACVGSPNFNQRSMRKDDELGLAVFDPEIVAILDDQFQVDLQYADSYDLAKWEKRGIRTKLLESVVLLFENEI